MYFTSLFPITTIHRLIGKVIKLVESKLSFVLRATLDRLPFHLLDNSVKFLWIV